MELDIIGGSFEAKYKSLNAQRSINWFTVYSSQNEQDKNQKSLFPTPGATLFVNIPGRYNRDIYVAHGPTKQQCFTVVDKTLYEILDNQTYINRGVLSSLAYGADDLYFTIDAHGILGIWHPSASYNFNTLTNTLTLLSPNTNNNQFPGNVSYATYLDGYVVIVSNGIVWPSVNGSSSTWLSTQSFAPAWTAAPAVAVETLRNVLYVWTTEDVALYYNDGQTPYVRQDRTSIPIGLAAKNSLAKTSTGFFYLGKNSQGECGIYYYDGGFTCAAISSANISWRINSLGYTPTDAYGYVEYNKDGQLFYYLTIPDLNTTFVYNSITQDFHERQSKQDFNDSNGDNVYSYFRGKNMVDFKGMHLFSDVYSGQIFLQDATNTIFTENGNTIMRERYSQTFSSSQQLISATSLELDCDPGILSDNCTLQVYLSYDGGLTFQPPINVPLGPSGFYDYRVRLFKLGAARRWVINLTLTDAADLMIQKAIVHGSIANY